MIKFLLYNVILILLFKFDFFEKYKDKLNFRGIFLICLFSLFMFVMSLVTILKSDIIFGVDTTNPTLRKMIVLIYVGTVISIWSFLFADYFRKQSDKKESLEGPKGGKGLRGFAGERSTNCDERKCNLSICDNKILKHVSNVYSKILDDENYAYRDKENPKSSSTISNHYIQNKIKLLCKSNQLEKILNKDGVNHDKVYEHMNDTWTKWIQIIMQYKNGVTFLETQDLTDNDFDNMIDIKDRAVYNNWDNKETGTPSGGKESPFDEIKKYDMWYWGESQAAKIHIKYKCNLEKGPVEKYNINIKNSNEYENTWRSNVALQNKQMGTFIPFQRKGDPEISIYRPKVINENGTIYRPLGDIVIEDNEKDNLDQYKTTLVSGDIKIPDKLSLQHNFRRKEGVGKGVIGYSFWKPEMEGDNKDKYVCIGNMLDNKFNGIPMKENYVCVPRKCTRIKKDAKTLVWQSTESDLDEDPNPNNKSKTLEKLYRTGKQDKYNLFKFTGDENLEIIPEEEFGDQKQPSCINNLDNINDDSEWLINPKNDAEYSINSYFGNQ